MKSGILEVQRRGNLADSDPRLQFLSDFKTVTWNDKGRATNTKTDTRPTYSLPWWLPSGAEFLSRVWRRRCQCCFASRPFSRCARASDNTSGWRDAASITPVSGLRDANGVWVAVELMHTTPQSSRRRGNRHFPGIGCRTPPSRSGGKSVPPAHCAYTPESATSPRAKSGRHQYGRG